MRNQPRRGFTLIELLVVIGIIVVLIGLLIPVVAKVRTTAYVANTTNLMKNISAAVTSYQLNFRAYPGVLPNKAFDGGSNDLTPGYYFADATKYANFTQSEDLVCALTGGLTMDLTLPPAQRKLDFNSAYLGQGPVSFNPLNPGKSQAFMPANRADLSTPDTAISADANANQTYVKDSPVPEFMDKFPDPRPIIYLRANPGAKNVAAGQAPMVISSTYNPQYHYNHRALLPYMNPTIDATSSEDPRPPVDRLIQVPPTPALAPPADSGPVVKYFTSEQSSSTAKYAGTYILISTGPDRKYGTADDIVMGGGGGGQ